MFSFLRRSPPELQLYGKLPLAKDYLRIGCAEGTGRAFRDWLDRAFSTEADVRLELPWPMRFVVAAEEGNPIVGWIWNSSDAGALRSFPFTMFVARRRKEVRSLFGEARAEGRATWSELERLRAEGDGCADGRELLRRLRGATVETRAIAVEERRVSLDRWVQELWPDDGVSALERRLEELRSAPSDEPLVLPIASRLDVDEQVEAWWVVARLAGWIGPDDVPTSFVPSALDSGGEGRAVFLWRRALAPGDAASLCGELTAGKPLAESSPGPGPPADRPLADAVRDAVCN